MLFLGGFLENSCFIIEKYDILKKQWEDIDVLPYNKSKLASVALNNGNILTLGGKQVSYKYNQLLRPTSKQRFKRRGAV